MGNNIDNSTCLIIFTGFPTSCEVKYDILVKKSINNHFKQLWIVMDTLYFVFLLQNTDAVQNGQAIIDFDKFNKLNTQKDAFQLAIKQIKSIQQQVRLLTGEGAFTVKGGTCIFGCQDPLFTMSCCPLDPQLLHDSVL